MHDIKPNFLVVGASKSGTTSLYHYLRQVPGIFLSERKEPHYFVAPEVTNGIRDTICSPAAYYDLFAKSGNATWRGEMSVCYLYYFEQAIPRILNELGPATKIGIIVRNPIQRAYSAYLDVYRHNSSENLTFEQALAMENTRTKNRQLTPTMYYRNMGLYYRGVAAYMHSFKDVHVMLSDDLAISPSDVVAKFVEFLGGVAIPDSVDYKIHNVGGRSWNNRKVARWIKTAAGNKIRIAARRHMPAAYGWIKSAIFRLLMDRAKPMSRETREDLVAFYSSDVQQLGELIGRDLSHWLK